MTRSAAVRRRLPLRAARRPTLLALVAVVGCQAAPGLPATLDAQAALSANDFAELSARISEPGGFFDTDNLISNETGYLNVVDALVARGLSGGAYIGVGPDQNYSYIAHLRPEIVFISDIRRDNLLHHLLLKALVEGADTPLEFLAALHGVSVDGSGPVDEGGAIAGDIESVVERIDAAGRGTPGRAEPLAGGVRERIEGFGLALTEADFETMARFHGEFIRRGLDLRFTTFGRAPRPYYPTYRQLVLETDADGDRASWLSDQALYDVVRELHLANRIVPVVGDLAGPSALRRIGAWLEDVELEVRAIYTSNVEFYLWQNRTLDAWIDNVRALPAGDAAVVIRSYFPNFGMAHPSAIPGYYATQSLQPLSTLRAGGFTSYQDLVTRDVLPLR